MAHSSGSGPHRLGGVFWQAQPHQGNSLTTILFKQQAIKLWPNENLALKYVASSGVFADDVQKKIKQKCNPEIDTLLQILDDI